MAHAASLAVAESPIRNDNPDKGTETINLLKCQCQLLSIRNDNPDKGTETSVCD